MAAVTVLVGSAFILDVASPQGNARAEGQQSAIEEGSTALQAGNFDEAVTQFTIALESGDLPSETLAMAHLNRGLAHQRLSLMVEAIADYDYALQQDVLTPAVRAVALYNRGLANRRLYRTTLALEDFTNALILNARFAQAYNSRANVLRELGYYGTAVSDYDAAIRLEHPQLHIPLYGKALAHAALDDVTSAQRALARALVVNPDYAPARVLLARITSQPLSNDTETVIANNADSIETGTIADASSTDIARTPPPFSDEAEQQGNQLADISQDSIVATPAGGTLDRVAENTSTTVVPGQTQIVVPGPGFEDVDGSGERIDNIITAAVQPDAATTDNSAVQQAPTEGYLIQISAQRSQDAARGLWDRLAEQHTDVLGGLTPYIMEADLGSRGVFYRIRAGDFATRDAGNRICNRLKSRRVECFVIAAGG
jgi:tetratricopeptide (TPR) repeat protein